MAIHIWTILCTKASIDSESNIISLFEVIEQLNVGGIPEEERDQQALVPAKLNLASLWMRSDSEISEHPHIQFSLLQPDESILEGGQIDVNLDDGIRGRTIFRMNSIPIRGEGIYYFIIELSSEESSGREEVKRLPLEIRFSD